MEKQQIRTIGQTFCSSGDQPPSSWMPTAILKFRHLALPTNQLNPMPTHLPRTPPHPLHCARYPRMLWSCHMCKSPFGVLSGGGVSPGAPVYRGPGRMPVAPKRKKRSSMFPEQFEVGVVRAGHGLNADPALSCSGLLHHCLPWEPWRRCTTASPTVLTNSCSRKERGLLLWQS